MFAARWFLGFIFILGALHSGAANDHRNLSSAHTDGEAQLSIAEIAGGDPKVIAELESNLKLGPLIDITKEFEAGTLEASVRKLNPLRASSFVQTPSKSLEPAFLIKKPKAYVASATIWASDNSTAFIGPSGRLNIPVCWLNPDANNDRGRKLARAAVTSTWEFYGSVSFVGWNKCKQESTGIKILVSDERPWSVYGRLSDPESPSMVLNFTFADSRMNDCRNKRDTCIYSIAVHEFGHALGFLHEQDSPETPQGCAAKLRPGDIQKPLDVLKAKMLTDWDEVSVMNYCFDIYARRVQLSDCDVAAYQSRYHKPPGNAYQTACEVKMSQ